MRRPVASCFKRYSCPVTSCTSAMVTADADLTAAAQKAGVDLATDPVMLYLKATKIQTSSSIAVYFKDIDAIQATVQKLVAGVNVRGAGCKLGTEDPDAINAAWIVRYEIVKMKYQASITAAAPALAPSAPSTTPPASSTTDKDNIPKTLPAGVYNQLVKDYNDVTLKGEKRAFPEKVLLGADKVLATVHHEHTVSKHYTAVTLGEIMSQRVFAALGANTNWSKEPSDWDVRGLNMIQDGVDAVW